MNGITIDMYHGHGTQDADKVKVFWSDGRFTYWGWIFKNGEIIGDFNADSLQDVEKAFSHLLHKNNA